MKGRARKYDWDALETAIRAGIAAGKSVSAIAGEQGVSRGLIYKLVSRAGDINLPKKPEYLRHKLVSAGIRLGQIAPSFDRQPAEFKAWLARQAGDGVTIMDVVMAAALDQFNEETNPEN